MKLCIRDAMQRRTQPTIKSHSKRLQGRVKLHRNKLCYTKSGPPRQGAQSCPPMI